MNDVEITSGTLNIGNNVKVTGTTTNGVTGSGTGAIVLDETCLLDFSDQTNNIPITGTSISAVSGARAIPYGETESEAISVGTGNAVNKYGKCGYLVSVASGTTSNTLYDALVGGGTAYSNVIFDPALDGQTVSLVSGTTFSRTIKIQGNGSSLTNISGDVSQSNGVYLYVYDVNASTAIAKADPSGSAPYVYIYGSTFYNLTAYPYGSVTQTTCIGYLRNADSCLITGCTGGGYGVVRGDESTVITGSTLSNSINTGYGLWACGTIENCTFIDNACVALRYNSSASSFILRNSYFNNNKAAIALTAGTASISGCTFATYKDAITVSEGNTVTFKDVNILNSTVSGAGTVVFAYGSTTSGSGIISSIGKLRIPQHTSTVYEGPSDTFITGMTITGIIQENAMTTGCNVIDCVITGNTTTGSNNPFFNAYEHDVYIKGSTVTGNMANMGGTNVNCSARCLGNYAHVIVEDSTVQMRSDGSASHFDFIGTCDVSMACTSGGAAGSGILRIAAGSTISLSGTGLNPSWGNVCASISIVQFDSETRTWGDVSGTATVIVGGNTLTLSGTGTYIDTTRTNTTDLTVVE